MNKKKLIGLFSQKDPKCKVAFSLINRYRLQASFLFYSYLIFFTFINFALNIYVLLVHRHDRNQKNNFFFFFLGVVPKFFWVETGPRIEKSAINSSNLLQASNSRVFLSNRRRTAYSFQFLHDQNQPKFEQLPSLSLSISSSSSSSSLKEYWDVRSTHQVWIQSIADVVVLFSLGRPWLQFVNVVLSFMFFIARDIMEFVDLSIKIPNLWHWLICWLCCITISI